jgi:hypothetical protein
MQNQKIRLNLNAKFYDVDSVKEALNDFGEICEGKILNKNIDVELIIKESVPNLKEEFCNYVLGLMKNKIIV